MITSFATQLPAQRMVQLRSWLRQSAKLSSPDIEAAACATVSTSNFSSGSSIASLEDGVDAEMGDPELESSDRERASGNGSEGGGSSDATVATGDAPELAPIRDSWSEVGHLKAMGSEGGGSPYDLQESAKLLESYEASALQSSSLCVGFDGVGEAPGGGRLTPPPRRAAPLDFGGSLEGRFDASSLETAISSAISLVGGPYCDSPLKCAASREIELQIKSRSREIREAYGDGLATLVQHLATTRQPTVQAWLELKREIAVSTEEYFEESPLGWTDLGLLETDFLLMSHEHINSPRA